MARLMRKAAACAVLSGCMMLFGGAGTAHAVPLDNWSTAESIVNSVAGTSRCTIGASTPVRSGNVVAGSASISCNRTYLEITLTVCIQGKPAAPAPDSEWVDLGCSPPKTVQNTSGTSGTAQGQCLPVNAHYRVQAHAVGFQTGDTQENPTFDMLFHGDTRTMNCGLAAP
jgi:hypothetical protein